MRSFNALGLAVVIAVVVHAGDQPPAITVHEVTTPANAHSLGASMTTGPDGTVWLSWIEPAANASVHAARIASFDSGSSTWSVPHTIVADASVAPSSDDFPQVAVDGAGVLFVVWTDGRGGARFSTSRDRGVTWTKPQPWSTRKAEVEKFSLTRLAGGRVLAAWLDNRASKPGAEVQQLFARVINGVDESDELVDASVCDCCPTSLAAFIDGGALLAYRGRTAGEVRDIAAARFKEGRWQAPRVISHDDWRIAACPVNGPRIATDGSRVAAAWFTAAGNEPRVLASYSPDAGARWLMPLRVDRGRPVGHVETALLRDGAFLVIWVETDGSLWLRRISPEYTLSDPIELAGAGVASSRSVPRASLLRDYAGGHTSATLLVGYTRAREPAGVHTVAVQIPEGDLFEAERNCNCAPTLEQLTGFPIRGTFTALDAKEHSAQVRHGEVPGVFDAGTRVFAIAPAEFAPLHAGRAFLGRVEWRNGAWHLFDIRLLAEPAKALR